MIYIALYRFKDLPIGAVFTFYANGMNFERTGENTYRHVTGGANRTLPNNQFDNANPEVFLLRWQNGANNE